MEVTKKRFAEFFDVTENDVDAFIEGATNAAKGDREEKDEGNRENEKLKVN